MFRRRKRKLSNDAIFMISGAAVGGILGLLFAPKKGSELRSDIKNEVDNTLNKTIDAASGLTEQVLNSGDELVRRAAEVLNVSQQAVGNGYQSTIHSVQNEISQLRRAFDSAVETYKNYKKSNPAPVNRRVNKVFTDGEVEYSDETLPKVEGMGRRQS
jgi:gas vesicle protein